MGERCERCGSIGSDRRTLHMACFYAMEELGVPFEREVLFWADMETLEKATEPVGIDLPGGKRLNIQSGTVRSREELHPQELYTLRVCKRCRSEWLAAIKEWFRSTPKGEDHDADEPTAGAPISRESTS